jgi:hypothetical protein
LTKWTTVSGNWYPDDLPFGKYGWSPAPAKQQLNRQGSRRERWLFCRPDRQVVDQKANGSSWLK